MLPCPVRKTIGICSSPSAIRFCRSSPLRPGSCRSSTRQLGAAPERARNSCADANVSTRNPTDHQPAQSLARRQVVVYYRDNGFRRLLLRHMILLLVSHKREVKRRARAVLSRSP